MACHNAAMISKRLTNVVVMLLVASGLLFAPLATPVTAVPVAGDAGRHDMMAMSSDTPAMSGDMVMPADAQAMSDDRQAMSGEMPCCPGQTKIKDCGSCPFVALCLLSVSLPAPSGAMALIERYASQSTRVLRDDLLRDGLGAKPPDHPPRTLV